MEVSLGLEPRTEDYKAPVLPIETMRPFILIMELSENFEISTYRIPSDCSAN